MLKVIIQRQQSRDDGTLGNLTIVGKPFTAYTIELSDRGNVNDISCILPGTYTVSWVNHPVHGWCWQLMNVAGRQAILIHSANLAGNTEQGYVKQVLGCIAMGSGVGMFLKGQTFHVEGPNGPDVEPLTRDQRGITGSVAALAAFNAVMGTANFSLEIRQYVESTGA